MNIDQRALQDGSLVVGHDNDSLTYRILHNSTCRSSEVRCCEKNIPPSSVMVFGIDEGSNNSDHLGNEYEIQNVETTGLDSVGENNAVKKQDDALTLRFRKKSNTNTLQYNTIHHNTIHYNTIQYNTIQYNTIQYNTIQYNTTQYNTIQYNTIQYNTIQYNTIQYNTIQYNTIQYNTIQYNTIQYNTIQYNTIQYNTIQYNTIQYNTIQYNTIQYNTIQYNTIQYNTIQYNTIQYNTKGILQERKQGTVVNSLQKNN